MNTNKIKQLFVAVAKKVEESLANGNATEPKPGIVTNYLLIRNGLLFQEDVADLFFKNVDEASEELNSNKAWSKASVDRIFSAGLEEVAKGVSIQSAADSFTEELNKPHETFKFRLGVFGLEPDCSPAEFGHIKLVQGVVTAQFDFHPAFPKNIPTHLHFAEVSVEAIDAESAKLRAEALVDQHLATLNVLCADGLRSFTFLSRHHRGSRSVEPYEVESNGEWAPRFFTANIRRRYTAPEWQRTLNTKEFATLSTLLKTDTPFSEHLVSALERVGETVAEESARSAFLLLAVCLERTLMGEKSGEGISNQFALRASILSLGGSKTRLGLYKRIKRLYQLRSEIVHRGASDITGNDLLDMRNVCVGCIFALIFADDFSKFKNFEELDSWFIEQMLTAPEPRFSN